MTLLRPKLKFLSDELITQIIEEALTLLEKLGIEIHNPAILDFLNDFGARVDLNSSKVFFSKDITERALKSSPSNFKLYDVNGKETNNFSEFNIHFTPGSAALNILDYKTNDQRKPPSKDYIKYVKLVNSLNNIASQSTAFVPSDVPQEISDSIRLFYSLFYGHKPVVTGCFSKESFDVMKNIQIAVRGNEKILKEKPLTIFSVCPTSPLKWSDVTSQNLLDCAKYSIPVEFISMPLSGFMSPVTIVGTLVQHTAETLSGIAIHQMINPGAPFLYGGSPAIFDVRNETTPMGAVETMMIDCAYNEIGKHFNVPTQAYISLSDAKEFDYQSGMETVMGAVLGSLAGINNMSGAGMHDFENCISLEKLVIDNDICGMCLRLVSGIEPKEDFPSLPHFEELLAESQLLISNHTRKYLKKEIYFPSNVINRANYSRWKDEGSKKVYDIAHEEAEKLINIYEQPFYDSGIKKEIEALMLTEAKKFNMNKLPAI
jgi:trimethylamine--corrinoid protein Co-methyltransferase